MPFKSKAQQRFMFAAESRGDLPKGTAKRWAHHTDDIKDLPEHVSDKKEAYFRDYEFAPSAITALALKLSAKSCPKVKDVVTPNPGGTASKHPDIRVCPDELHEGAKVEKEHTTSHTKAKAIAADHVVEIPDYYKRLEKLEDKAKDEGVKRAAMIAVPNEQPVPGIASSMVPAPLTIHPSSDVAGNSVSSNLRTAMGSLTEAHPNFR